MYNEHHETITITCPHCRAPLTATFEVSATRRYAFACDHCGRDSIVTIEARPKTVGPSETKDALLFALEHHRALMLDSIGFNADFVKWWCGRPMSDDVRRCHVTLFGDDSAMQTVGPSETK